MVYPMYLEISKIVLVIFVRNKSQIRKLGGGEIGWYQDKYNKYSLKRKLVYKRTTQNYKRRRCEPQNPVTRNEVDADYGPAADLYIPTQIEKNEFLAGLEKTPQEMSQIFSETIDQSASCLWMMEREKRLTASSFGRGCKLRASTDRKKVATNMVNSTFSGNIYTRNMA
jgi:hypothetical protein